MLIFNLHFITHTSLLAVVLFSFFIPAIAIAENSLALKWVANEFQPSTLTQAEQMQEMNWFIEVSKPYQGMQIRVVSERIATHGYEANILAKAFFEITGIHVVHELTGEDDVIKKLSAQIATQQNIYDAYINDSDLIGTHFRSNAVLPISDFIKGQGASVTLPSLDLPDFIGLKFTTGPDGKLYQLPDQQFAICIGIVMTGLAAKILKNVFNPVMGMHLAFHKIGKPMKISLPFLVKISRKLMGNAYMVIWIMPKRILHLVGVCPMRGFQWQVLVIRGYPMAFPLMNGE